MIEKNIGKTSLYISDGNYSSKYPKAEEFLDKGVPFISAYNIREGRIVWDKMKYISAKQHQLLQRGHIKEGDVLLITRGSIGAVAYVTKEFEDANINAQLVLLRANGVDIDKRYLYYATSTNEFFQHVQNRSSGTAQPQLPIHQLVSIPVRLHDIDIQRKIAEVLSAYDDLIEVNTRRIRILEQMAQAVYHEWFGKVNAQSLPEGWKIKPFSELVEIDPTTYVDKQIEKPFVGMNALSESSMVIDLDLVETRTGNSGAKFQNRDVLFPRITPSVENGKGAFVQFLKDSQVAIGSTEIIVFREKEIKAEYIYFLSREHEFRGNAINSMVGASGRQRVQQRCFDTFMVAKPPKELQQNFADIVLPMFEITHTLALKNANLRRTRDLLLPRLVSGEVGL